MQVKVFKIIVVELEPVKTGPALQDFELPLFLVFIVLYTSIFWIARIGHGVPVLYLFDSGSDGFCQDIIIVQPVFRVLLLFCRLFCYTGSCKKILFH